MSNFCLYWLLPFALEWGPSRELAHANLLPAPSPVQFPRELKAQRAAWILSKDCEPLNSLRAQLQQTSFKQSSAAVGRENLAVNSAKSSYLSLSERHQHRKESSFSGVLSVFKYISYVYMPPLLTLCPSLGSEEPWICRKEESEHLHSGKNPDSPGKTWCHWANHLALKVPCCIPCILPSRKWMLFLRITNLIWTFLSALKSQWDLGFLAVSETASLWSYSETQEGRWGVCAGYSTFILHYLILCLRSPSQALI